MYERITLVQNAFTINSSSLLAKIIDQIFSYSTTTVGYCLTFSGIPCMLILPAIVLGPRTMH